MISWLQQTAWPMTPPLPYSEFHLYFLLLGGFSAILTARVASFFIKSENRIRLLFLCGLILAASEVYKQCFLYHIVNNRQYDWWYFPFQLCSIPMYLCILLPLCPKGRLQNTFCAFLRDFGLLGGVMALLEPSGLMHPYWTLTLHGLLWHLLLIFIGCFAGFSGLCQPSAVPYRHVLSLFFLCSLIASWINLFAAGKADMFYISPYVPMGQVVFDQIALRYGNLTGIMAYLLSVCVGGWIVHALMDALH